LRRRIEPAGATLASVQIPRHFSRQTKKFTMPCVMRIEIRQ
jgi:hypothetical protein